MTTGAIPDETEMQGGDMPMPNDAGTDAMSVISSVYSYGQKKNGLGGGQQEAYIPMRPAGPGGDQPDTNPFPTKTAPIPFGKRYAGGGSVEDDYAIAPIPEFGQAEPVSAVMPASGPAPEFPEDGMHQTMGAVPDEAGPGESYSPPPEQEQGANWGQMNRPKGDMSAGPGPSNAQMIMRYLQGADAAPPQVVVQIERRVDPQGSMDEDSRKIAAIDAATKQGGEEAGWGLMQHYRQKYDRYRSFAAAALHGTQQKPGDLRAAVQAANQAFSNVPDGQRVQFTPGQTGVTATVTGVDGKPLTQVNLTAEQFDKVLSGNEGLYDNFMINKASAVFDTLGKSGAFDAAQPVPYTAARSAPQQSASPAGGGQAAPQQSQQPAGPNWNAQLEARSRQIFPFVSQEQQRLQWLANAEAASTKSDIERQKAEYGYLGKVGSAEARSRGQVGAAGLRSQAQIEAAKERASASRDVAGTRAESYNQRTASNERIAGALNVSRQEIAKIQSAARSRDAAQRSDAATLNAAIRLGPMFDPNAPTAPAVYEAARRLGVTLGGAPQAATPGAPQAATPQAPAPQAPGAGEKTRVINGHTYKKVEGGWQLVK